MLGQTLIVDGRAVTIVGVTAPEFTGLIPGRNPDITLPLSVRAIDEPEIPDDARHVDQPVDRRAAQAPA